MAVFAGGSVVRLTNDGYSTLTRDAAVLLARQKGLDERELEFSAAVLQYELQLGGLKLCRSALFEQLSRAICGDRVRHEIVMQTAFVRIEERELRRAAHQTPPLAYNEPPSPAPAPLQYDAEAAVVAALLRRVAVQFKDERFYQGGSGPVPTSYHVLPRLVVGPPPTTRQRDYLDTPTYALRLPAGAEKPTPWLFVPCESEKRTHAVLKKLLRGGNTLYLHGNASRTIAGLVLGKVFGLIGAAAVSHLDRLRRAAWSPLAPPLRDTRASDARLCRLLTPPKGDAPRQGDVSPRQGDRSALDDDLRAAWRSALAKQRGEVLQECYAAPLFVLDPALTMVTDKLKWVDFP
ncbi:hypothetical protein M885DRAFT_619268 [Pelagophyceae sp. CCMP2097]|nr:hypothetical protein M885DRAFT_619268 [Pelagophyceae sp. CCMP2097]